jgi:hypothetical protein
VVLKGGRRWIRVVDAATAAELNVGVVDVPFVVREARDML